MPERLELIPDDRLWVFKCKTLILKLTEDAPEYFPTFDDAVQAAENAGFQVKPNGEIAISV